MLIFQWTAFGASLLCLAAVVYEDFKYRGVTWWLFPLLLISLLGVASGSASWQEIGLFFLLNNAFLLSQLVILSLYYSIKNGALTNITLRLLGIGDVLFMGTVGILFCLPNYLVFHVSSLLFSILATLLFSCLRERGVPLAGLQALFLIIFLGFSFFAGLNPFDDRWISFLFSSKMN